MEKKLPEGWKEYKIKDIGDVVTGSTPPKKDPENYGGVLPWIKPPDLDIDKFVSTSEETISETGRKKVRLLPKGSVLVSCIGNIGKVAIADTELCTNQQINSIIPDENIVVSDFLYYTIKKIRPYLENIASSAVVPLLNKTDFSNINIKLPPLETQKKIVSILEKAEETRKLRAQADELTQKLLQSVFLEMFGDPTKNSRGWDVRKLGEIITDSMNGLYLPKEKYTSHEGIKMVHMSDAFYGIVELGNLKRVLATKKEIDKYGLTKNDLLVARRSLNFEGAAKASKIPELNEPLIFESSLIKVSPDLKLVTTIYLYHYLNNELVRKTYIYKHITKSTISGINQNSLKNISVILPPIKVQNKFSDFVEQAEKTILNQQQSSLEINTLFDALMQKAFTGELVA
ncbi:restriction endonuclease subunit S [Methanosarcina mazei]|uniref:Type I restriction-modification system, specificity subunit S n=1 Tax=Methanosarcina mazei LYC TaxID=1434114 RepID=A0A0E3WNX0_METMZ|nr:restriction endonuclease subunit S [Methanosarcina mazei]AKB68172.1 Type I restriction-modification system, specificity subunit S [Methanosarcina mazei LYC]